MGEMDRLPPMTNYVLGLFRTAPNRPTIGDEEAEKIQEGHLADNRRLREQGHVIAVGPLSGADPIRGILIFQTDSVDRARELKAMDPAILEGRLVLDLYPWFSQAGLTVVPPSPRG
jgi:uncharacterized protein